MCTYKISLSYITFVMLIFTLKEKQLEMLNKQNWYIFLKKVLDVEEKNPEFFTVEVKKNKNTYFTKTVLCNTLKIMT